MYYGVKQPRWKISVVAFLFFVALGVRAQGECSALLHQGIYDLSNTSIDDQKADSFSQWFCDQRFYSESDADSFGVSLGFPFKGIPVKLGFDSANQSYSNWQSSFCEDTRRSSITRSSIRKTLQTVNPTILDAFKTCIGSRGLHVWLERTSDPTVFMFRARYNSNGAPSPKITSFVTGPNVKCNPWPATRVVDGSGLTSRCRRTKDPVAIAINADQEPVGGNQLTLPGILPYSVVTSIKVAPPRVLNRNCGFISDGFVFQIGLRNVPVDETGTLAVSSGYPDIAWRIATNTPALLPQIELINSSKLTFTILGQSVVLAEFYDPDRAKCQNHEFHIRNARLEFIRQ
jgi:hypothetical protein